MTMGGRDVQASSAVSIVHCVNFAESCRHSHQEIRFLAKVRFIA